MTRRARRAWPVVTLLLASVITASAECAWVLWMHSVGGGIELHRLELARPTRTECVAFIEHYAETLKSDAYTLRGYVRAAPEVYGQKGVEHVRYICLPDTIDPRGPKQ